MMVTPRSSAAADIRRDRLNVADRRESRGCGSRTRTSQVGRQVISNLRDREGSNPPKCDVHRRDPQCPVHVDIVEKLGNGATAKISHSRAARHFSRYSLRQGILRVAGGNTGLSAEPLKSFTSRLPAAFSIVLDAKIRVFQQYPQGAGVAGRFGERVSSTLSGSSRPPVV
jgi:hypothetical protein